MSATERPASAERTKHDALDPAHCSACLEHDRKVADLEGGNHPTSPTNGELEQARRRAIGRMVGQGDAVEVVDDVIRLAAGAARPPEPTEPSEAPIADVPWKELHDWRIAVDQLEPGEVDSQEVRWAVVEVARLWALRGAARPGAAEPRGWPKPMENRLDQALSYRGYVNGWNECLADCKRALSGGADPLREAFDAMVIVDLAGRPCYRTDNGIPQAMPKSIERKVRAALSGGASQETAPKGDPNVHT